jgi:hypothetical protein
VAALRWAGFEVSEVDSGCCGMAGSFGFDEEKFDVSMAIGELELLPAVRHAPPDSLIIADGFSCREQIAQSTDRHALHLAEVIATALKGPLQPDGAYPEQPQVDQRQAELDRSMKRAGLAVAGIAAGVALLWWLKGRK